jgi:uncharacterized SAM-dependent methyltransferase
MNASLRQDVREGLSRTPKQLPPKYLYDELGSALFEAICALPWYRVTRAETALLSLCAPSSWDPAAGTSCGGWPRPLAPVRTRRTCT